MPTSAPRREGGTDLATDLPPRSPQSYASMSKMEQADARQILRQRVRRRLRERFNGLSPCGCARLYFADFQLSTRRSLSDRHFLGFHRPLFPLWRPRQSPHSISGAVRQPAEGDLKAVSAARVRRCAGQPWGRCGRRAAPGVVRPAKQRRRGALSWP